MTKQAITKLDIPFRCTGDMWSSIYGDFGDTDDDDDFRSKVLVDEMQSSINDSSSDIFMGVVDKKIYMMHRSTIIKGYLNTVVISMVDEAKNDIPVVTTFPEISNKETLKAELLEVCEYNTGFEARLKIKVEVKNDFFEHENTFWIFDTRYILNKDKYKIGKKYTFHIGALITHIIHRPEEGLSMQMSERSIKMMKKALKKSGEPFTDDSNNYKVLTHDMFALNPMYDDNPEAFYCQEKFTLLKSEELQHPKLPDDIVSYIFHIKSHEIDGKPGYTIPAYVNDITFLLSPKEGDRRSNIFEEGDPIDIKGIMQGYLVA